MKNKIRLTICAALTAGMMSQVASAGVLFTNQVKNIQARNVRATLGAGTGIATGEIYSFTGGAIRNQYTVAAGGQTGKAWIQFDLSETWALYGQTNLSDAKLWLWNQNGSSRQFWVAGIADGAGLESWDQNSLTWSNAPANDYFNTNRMGYGWDYSKLYGGTNLWEVNSGAQGIDVSTVTVGQGSLYISTNSTSKVKEFLQTDTDGKVTIGISDGPYNSNQTIPIGTNGVYASDPLAPNGLPTRSSPTLTLVFDVRIALTGGGTVCPGDSGVEVSMFGTDPGYDYLLFTNGVYSKTVSGTGSSVSFGLQNTTGSYTAMSSNTTTTVVAPVPSTVTVSVPPAPTVSVQPAPVVAATNSSVTYTVSAVGSGGGYQWFRNGVALSDDGHYSGTATAQLIISPVLAADAATSANGYYVRVQNLCGATAFSTTNALTIQASRSLVWNGTPTNIWDVATTANWWLNTAGGPLTTFQPGDNVTLDQNGVTGINLASSYLSPGVITFNGDAITGIGGSGNISGPNSSLFVGGTLNSKLIITNANNFAGGTTISNGWLVLRNNGSVGTNTITLAGTGDSVLEVVPTGSASSGIPGLKVTANSVMQVNGNSAFSAVILGPLTGTPGKTLTVVGSITPGNNIRLYGNFTCDNNIVLNIAGGNWASYQSGTAIYNGVLSGNAVLYPRSGITILSGANTFDQTIISQGDVGVGIDSNLGSGYSPLGLGTFMQDNQGNVGILAYGGARVIENPFTWVNRANANSTFKLSGTNQLTMSGAFDLANGTNNINRILQVDNTAPTILSGVLSDAGQNMGVTKTGNGALYLRAANTYTGPTTNSAGLLAGLGSISGPLVVGTSGVLGGGSPTAIGTFTVNNNVTLNGGVLIRLNKSLAPAQSNDMVSVSGALANSGIGTVTVTNLGPALQVGNSFKIFNKAVANGNAMTVAGAGVTWTNKLALDGSIEVISTVANYPTNLSYTVSGNLLGINWPSTHLGWILQVQTNALKTGITTNWVDVPGTSGATSANITINPSNSSVFYRLRNP